MSETEASKRGLPDFEILSGGGDLFSPDTDPEAFQRLAAYIAGMSRAISGGDGMADVIRDELRKGSYQMPGDTLPYQTQANAIAARLAAAGFGLVPSRSGS